MKLNKALLLGLIALFFLWVLMLFDKWDFIEKDVASNAQQALSEAGHDWVNVSTNDQGRNVTLSGIARSEQQKQDVIDITKSTYSVAFVDFDEIEIKPLTPASLSASLDSGAITLGGNVASQSDANGLLSAAGAISDSITNNLTISSDNAEPGWLSSIVGALPVLGVMDSGRLSVIDDKLSLSGIVRNQTDLDQLQGALSNLSGISAADTSGLEVVALPNAEFSANLVNDVMVLKGKVSSQAEYDALVDAAKAAFADVDISGLSIDGGVASAPWLGSAATIMSGMAGLKDPALQIVENAVQVSGLTKNVASADAWNRVVQDAMANGIDVHAAVSEMELTEPKFNLAYDGSQVNLSGELADFATQSALEWASGALSQNVDASALSAKEGVDIAPWLENVVEIIPTITDFSSASLSADPSGISLNGMVGTEAERDAVTAAMQKALGGEIDDSVKLAIDVEKTNAQLAAEAEALAEAEAQAKAEADAKAKAEAEAEAKAKAEAEAAALAAAEAEAAALAIQNANKICEDKWDVLLKDNAIQFATGSAEINQASNDLLNGLAELIKQCADVSIEVGGHTDSTGDAVFNQYLSNARAASVMSYLGNSGVDQGRLSAKGYGSEQPIADNSTAVGRAQNRRIEINIIKN